MKDITSFIKRNIFKDSPEKAPSSTTLRRLMVAPNRSRNSSALYKGLIQAKPGSKQNDNNPRGVHQNRHHQFASVKMAREWAAINQEEVVTLSCDDKNKIKCGKFLSA